jgi:uroporphyrinogen decarboxylase
MSENKPDFSRIETTLSHKEPDRVPLIEAAVAYETMSKFLGREVSASDYDSQIEFWIKAGYDYIALTAGMMQPGKVTEDSLISKVIKENLQKRGDSDSNWNLEERAFISDEKDFELFPWEEAAKVNIDYFYEVDKKIPKGMKIVALSGKIFTLSSLLMGYENFCVNLMLNPEFIEKIIEKVAAIQYETIEKIIKIPSVAAIWAVDDIAFGSGPMLNPNDLRKYLFPWYKKLGQLCHQNNRYFFYHSDGSLWSVMDDLIDLGIDALHPIDPTCMDIDQVKKEVGDRITLFGNISNELLQNGSPEDIEELTKQRMKCLAPGGGYCLGSGNSVPEWAEIDNYRAMIDTVKKYGTYPINIS